MASGLRERKRAATHRAISGAALRLFAERGYDEVTVDEIVAECEVSPRTFFRYFGSKEEVLFATGDERRRELLERLRDQPASATPFEAVAGAIRAMVPTYVGARSELELRADIIAGVPGLQGRDAELPRRWDREVATELRESGRAGGVDELRLRVVVAATMSALRTAIEMWLASPGADLTVLVERSLAYVATGCD